MDLVGLDGRSLEGRGILILPDLVGYTRADLINVTTGSRESNAKVHDALHAGNEAYKTLIRRNCTTTPGGLRPKCSKARAKATTSTPQRVAMVKAEKVYDGRIFLLGDAGYAVTVYGISNAMVGAYAN